MQSETQETQESTEPVDWAIADSGYEDSQQSQSEPDHWGRFYPLKPSLDVIDLVSNSVTFGKVHTDVLLTRDHIPPEVYSKCSRTHFEVQRRQVSRMGAQTTQVEIIDRSSNGTFINGHVLRRKSKSGPQRRKVLRSNDIIGLPAGSPVVYEAYVFIDSLVSTTSLIPCSVRKKYQISVRLGAGAFGEVSLVFDKIRGKPYAMKTIVKDTYANSRITNCNKKRLLNELDILRTVKHPNVIKLIDVMSCEKEHFLLLEFMEGKDLSHRIFQQERLEESITKLYFYQITKGVQYLHSQGIIHRDLKPANILLLSSKKETVLKITDFGLSKVLSPITIMKTLCGTKLYVAPEVLFGAGTFEYTEQVDIWSMGVILFLCLSGTEPFDTESDSLENQIKEAAFAMPKSQWRMISDEAKSLIRRILVKEPQERATINEIINDSWMQDDTMIAKAHSLYDEEKDSTGSFSTVFSSMALESTLCNSLDMDIVGSQDGTLTHDCSSPPRKKCKRN